MPGTPLVLLAEPDVGTRAALKDALEAAHVRVVLLDGSDAASRAALVAPQLVVVSLLSARTDGLSLLASWHDLEERSSIPVLAIHPGSDEGLAEQALASGADDVLAWPTTAARLRSRVRGLTAAATIRAEGDAFFEVLTRLVTANETREPHRAGHSARVARLATSLAAEAGLGAAETERIRRGARLHDVGFVALPDALLLRSDPLPREEEAQIRSHPVVGAELLAGVPAFEPLRIFVLRHHERLDGSGYPDGLKGEEIPLAVQLLSLADAWDGMTSWRPHRPRRGAEEALETLRAEARAGLWDSALISLLPAARERASGTPSRPSWPIS